MLKKELKQLKKQITQPIKTVKKQIEEKPKNKDISFADYCNSLNISKFNQDKIAMVSNKPKSLANLAQNNNEYPIQDLIQDFDFIDMDNIPIELFHNGQKNLPRDLRNGKYIINKTIDIHGLNKNRAWQQIESLIEQSISGSVIKIIHGQGINSKHNQAVLQNITRKLLYDNRKILAYTYGSPQQGGSGVTIVKLRN
ncbi:MAG: Smr/MutS family protein [Burkholderiales bacterium]|nr:Smr/MutS family protein [Burkholderiales bacterium]